MGCFKKFFLVLIAIFSLFLLSGCWDARDINEKLIITTIAFDINNDEILFYLEIANIESGNSDANESGGSKYIVVKGKGKTLPEVRDNLETKLDKHLYLSGVWALIFTKDFAQKYFVEYLYRFRVDETYRKKGITVITEENPEKLFENAHKNNISVGLIIDGIVKTLDELGKTVKKSTILLLENISCSYTGILLPCIGLEDEKISMVGYSVINDSKVIGFLPADESIGTMLLRANKPKFIFIVPYNDINFTIEVLVKKRIIKPVYNEGKIIYNIIMKFRAELMYGDKKTPYNFDENIEKEVTNILTTILNDHINNAITKAQNDFACDYLQFNEFFRIKYPNKFKELNWNNEFKNISSNIEMKVELKSKWGMNYTDDKTK